MSLRRRLQHLATPTHARDERALAEWCNGLGATPMNALENRVHQRVAGEVKGLRVIPKAGAETLEVILTDGRGSVTGVFFGRRRIPGVTPGRYLELEGLIAHRDGRWEVLSPSYTLR